MRTTIYGELCPPNSSFFPHDPKDDCVEKAEKSLESCMENSSSKAQTTVCVERYLSALISCQKHQDGDFENNDDYPSMDDFIDLGPGMF